MTRMLDTSRRRHDRQPGLGHPLGTGQPTGMKNEVRALRIAKDMAQGQLAEAMGVSRQTINSIENERYTPSLPLAMALARYFGVTVEEMFDDQS
jgi:putative transcriptional regulator